MALKDVRNLLLINHNDGFIDDDEFVVLYDLFALKNLDFPYDSYAPFDLEELDESESFAEFLRVSLFFCALLSLQNLLQQGIELCELWGIDPRCFLFFSLL